MRTLLSVLSLLLALSTFSQGRKGFQVLIGTENDILGINNKDENYTGGLRAELLTPQIGKFWQPFIRFKDAGHLNIQRFAIGFTAYTPQGIKSTAVVQGDRPFASLNYFSLGNTSYSGNNKWMIQSDIILGAMGQETVGSAQAYIHRNHWFGSTRPEPGGWNNQIGYDGNFVINYNTRFQRSLGSLGNQDGFDWLQPNWSSKVDIGTYMINFQSGFKFNLLNYNASILNEYNPDLPTAVPQVYTVNAKKFRFNLFAEPHIRIAAYNATLEGLMFNDHSIYKIDHSDVNRVLFEINAGFNMQFWDVVYLRYVFYGRSKEFSGGKPFHTWGGVTLGFSPQKWSHN